MAYERNWHFLSVQGPRVSASVNDQIAYYLWMLKSFLKGEIGGATLGLWTCTGSSDGTTAGLDGVDRWTSTYNVSKIPYVDNNTGARGWMVLQRTVSVTPQSGPPVNYTVYLLLSCRGGVVTASNGLHRVSMGTGVPTGGTTTADPTMSQVFWQKSTVNAIGTYSADATNNRRYYGGLTSNGDFWMVETILGELGRCSYFVVPVGTKSNDQFPFFASFVDAQNVQSCYPFSGNSLYTYAAVVSAGTGESIFYNGGIGYAALNQPSSIVKLDATDVSLFDRPAFVEVWNATSVPSLIHSRGRLPDFGLVSGFITNTIASCRPVNIGSTVSDAGNVVYVTLNQVILPYNALIS